MYMEQIKKVVNSSWFKSIAIGIIGIALIAEKHLLYSGIAFGFAIREFLLSLKPECDVCKK
tara:strand:+ start:2484 stop:2666 length:183 start_codon:yes stop_codon:yes gene_type:complete